MPQDVELVVEQQRELILGAAERGEGPFARVPLFQHELASARAAVS
jgi:hypothetical protein